MIVIKHTTTSHSDIYEDALAIRKTVFVGEQDVPMDMEIEDEDVCVHFVLYEDDMPLATVRLFPVSETVSKVQRMAVEKQGRNKGLGRQIMLAAEEYAKNNGIKDVLLGAQTTAIGFYETMGYKAFGDEYLDAGIKHFDMSKTL
ncbi:MAG: GNAT family N-acetyltransferase [Vagococcus sp.]